jgi:anti-sigma factor RsiW
MNINRHNCEAWFLDFYEGQLSTDQVAELFAFLDAHPDLKEVFESYEGPAFDMAETDLPVFEHKDLLRRPVELPENINEVNYEEFFAAAIDNVLDAKGQIKLERFLESNPEKNSELELFRKTILSPDYSEKLEIKHQLKKPVVTAAEFDNWAVAALEGTLNAGEIAAFDAFLAANPAYKAEFELFGQTVLRPDTDVVFEHKDSLRKQPVEITAANFAEYAVSAMDGELSQTELAAFNVYLAANPGAAAEYELYASTRLQPDADVVFDAKAGLKKAVVEINAANFAEYAVAALDHALSSTELESLNRFVAQHPEMAAEMQAWQQTVLTPDTSIVFEHKAALYQTAATITAENFGEYAVAAIDGELSATETAALQAYMASNPHAAAEMEVWRNTVLTADTAVVYGDKDGLKRKAGGAVVWWLNSNVRYAAAAAVLLFVVTFWWSSGDVASIEGNMAGNQIKLQPYKQNNGIAPLQPDNNSNVAEQNPAPQYTIPGQNNNTAQLPDYTSNNQRQLAAIRPRFTRGLPQNRTEPQLNGQLALLSPDAVAIKPISVDEPGVAYTPAPTGSKISLAQYILRNTKNTLDRQPGTPADYTATAYNTTKQAKVTGWDVAGSAFNRVSRALGLNLGLNKSRTDGNSLNVGKYNVQLSPGEQQQQQNGTEVE